MVNAFDINQEIQSITRQLIEKYQPEKIILFGSVVHNAFNEEKSDLDFLIVKKEVPLLGRQRTYQLDTLIDYHIAADFIVYTPEEIEHLTSLHDQFIESIFQEGRLLYEKKPAISPMA